MRPVIESENLALLCGDSKTLDLGEGVIDAVVTDPPYELGFMGKKWDASGIAYDVGLWKAIFRALKPGGHLLAFGGTRTYHRMACAIEDAGFEIRDSLHWVYGSGFPKSLNVSKAIDDSLGAERTNLRSTEMHTGSEVGAISKNRRCEVCGLPFQSANPCRCPRDSGPATPEAERWDGWGTALKPAHEPIILARKPLEGTVAANVLAHGTGGLNVDGCRIGTTEDCSRRRAVVDPDAPAGFGRGIAMGGNGHAAGRWPANFVLSHSEGCVATGEVIDLRPSSSARAAGLAGAGSGGVFGEHGALPTAHVPYQDRAEIYRCTPGCPVAELDRQGGASRFFYVAKPSGKERDFGCEDLPARSGGEATDREDGSDGLNSPRAGAGRKGGRRNYHPTVKPIELMRWLVRLVTPPGGVVLDPFTGSGTTGIAAIREGFSFVGVEQSSEYVEIAAARLRAALKEKEPCK